jgi:hypothetical protein
MQEPGRTRGSFFHLELGKQCELAQEGTVRYWYGGFASYLLNNGTLDLERVVKAHL